MRYPTSLTILGCLLVLSCHTIKEEKQALGYHNPQVLMEVKDLLALPTLEPYTLVDFRNPTAYEKGHLPGAINIWRTDMENDAYPYGGMMPTKNQLEVMLSNKGIKTTDTLIVYDDRGSCDAARLWWVLDYYGFEQVKVLNGGLKSYVLENKPLSTQNPEIKKSEFHIRNSINPKRHIALDELKSLLGQEEEYVLLDCRSKEEYTGKRHKKGAKKAGRIPNSLELDWAHTIDLDQSHRFLPIGNLSDIYSAKLSDTEKTVVVYCHSGVRSAHTTFVLTQLLGYKNIKNYDGSWTEWSHHALPYEKDVETKIFE